MGELENILFRDSHNSFDASGLSGYESLVQEMTPNQTEEFYKLMEIIGVDLDKIVYNENSMMLNRVMYVEDYHYVDLSTIVSVGSVRVITEGMETMLEMFKTMVSKCKPFSDVLKGMKEKGDYESFFGMLDKKFLARELYDIVMEEEGESKGLSTGFMRGYIRMESGFEVFDSDFWERYLERVYDCPERKERIKELEGIVDEYGELKVYQGAKTMHGDGASWTTDIQVASFFANRFGSSGYMFEGTAFLGDVIDYYTSRSESEVLVARDSVVIEEMYETI